MTHLPQLQANLRISAVPSVHASEDQRTENSTQRTEKQSKKKPSKKKKLKIKMHGHKETMQKKTEARKKWIQTRPSENDQKL